MGVCGKNATEEIENKESHVAEPVFDVVAKYPEIEHIPPKVEQSAVHEH